MIDGHGDDVFRYGDKIRVNFSTNIPQGVTHTGLMSHLFGAGAIFRNYPEPEPRSVERKLAGIHGVESGNVIVTNGATEAIYLLAHAFAGGASAIVVPTFREYQDACRVHGHSMQFASSLEEIGSGNNIVWLCNPNNPTGQVYDKEELLGLADGNPSTLFVLDQAYALYSTREVISDEEIMCRKNVVVLHSLTKQFVVPGLRIGYAIGPAEIVDRLRRLRMPWSVNSIAIEAAHYLLQNESEYRFDSSLLHREAVRIGREMMTLGMEVSSTDCNFLLAKLPSGTSGALKEWLIENHGLLIRDASNFESLTPRHFRVAAQGAEENDLLISALREWTSLSQ